MKILYHHRTTASDGSAVHIDGLTTALRALGAEVVMIAPPTARRDVAAMSRSNSTALRQKLPRWLHELLELIYNVPEWLRLQAAIARHRPDVIYERSNLYLFSGIIGARCSRVPIIEEVNSPLFIERSLHGGIAIPWLGRLSERWVWRHADAVVTVTQVLADIVTSVRGSGGPIEVMPNGVDRNLFAADRIDRDAKRKLQLEGKTVLGFTGFVRDWNGLENVVDLLPRLRPEVVLLIVGDGPARSSLESRAHAAGVGARVTFTGVLAREAVASFNSAFDIALQPAANPYASPLKLFEYLALGRVVLAPDQPNLREVLTHGANAWLFDPREPGAMQRAIERLVNDVDLRQRLALGALRTIAERELTWERNAERVLELVRQLTHRTPAGQERSAPATLSKRRTRVRENLP
jgi:glycosyltransferase involved in cell wall biosynthesis